MQLKVHVKTAVLAKFLSPGAIRTTKFEAIYFSLLRPKRGPGHRLSAMSELSSVIMILPGVGQQDLANREKLHVLPGDGREGG